VPTQRSRPELSFSTIATIVVRSCSVLESRAESTLAPALVGAIAIGRVMPQGAILAPEFLRPGIKPVELGLVMLHQQCAVRARNWVKRATMRRVSVGASGESAWRAGANTMSGPEGGFGPPGISAATKAATPKPATPGVPRSAGSSTAWSAIFANRCYCIKAADRCRFSRRRRQ
jgi:hypothetical protein